MRHENLTKSAKGLTANRFCAQFMGRGSGTLMLSRAQRRRIASILRNAFRVLLKGKKRSVGALGRGANVAATLAAMGIGLAGFSHEAAAAGCPPTAATAGATGTHAVASGFNAQATGADALAIGSYANASGASATAIR